MEKEVKVQGAHNGKYSETQLQKEAMTAGVEALVKELRRIAKIVLVNSRPNIRHLTQHVHPILRMMRMEILMEYLGITMLI